jgi:Rv2525c-like, glycoside hydrolase-like domain
MTAVDFSFARFSAAQLKAAGVSAAGRYLTGAGKAISPLELAGLLFGGIEVWLIFENSATDASDGAAVGAQYAQEANVALVALGLPTTTPVYFSADQDYPNPADAVPYYQGIASVRPGATNGCYGEGALIDLLFSEGLVGYGFESESTSFPGNASASPNAAIWQKVNGAPLSGTDLDVILKADFGQLPRPNTPPQGGDVPAPTDVVASWSVPGSDGGAYFDLHADGGLFAYGGANGVLEYIASSNDGNRYHFPVNIGGEDIISYPGLPAADRQGTRYFVAMTVLSYEGQAVGQGPQGPAGPEGPAGPPGPQGNPGAPADLSALNARLVVAGKALAGE